MIPTTPLIRRQSWQFALRLGMEIGYEVGEGVPGRISSRLEIIWIDLPVDGCWWIRDAHGVCGGLAASLRIDTATVQPMYKEQQRLRSTSVGVVLRIGYTYWMGRFRRVGLGTEVATGGYVYAVASNVRWEASEPNDEVGTAAAFSHGVQGTLHAFRDGLGNRIIDVDWYRIEVGPFRRTTMQFTDYRNLPTPNSVVVVVRGEREVPVNSGDSIAIDNYSNRTRSMYVRVTIDPAEFFVRVGSGGGVGSYRINLVTIGSL